MAEETLSQVGEMDTSGTNLPSTVIGHAFTTEGACDDLVAKTDAYCSVGDAW